MLITNDKKERNVRKLASLNFIKIICVSSMSKFVKESAEGNYLLTSNRTILDGFI